uniref:Bro-N domain-containing protein n=1 Tax=Pyramimonas orientalis virus TaxID=455367 RepID=A0A7M3UPB3_POV01|nr:hypothetical protein HWQ62_00461 [Pyramimonas orientalis virus]
MDSLTTFTYNNVKYVLLEDIKEKELNKGFFKGCQTIRRCVDKHKIPEDKCVYMKNDKIYSKDYKSADLYIEQHYVKTNILDVEYFKNKTNNDKKQLKENKEELKKVEREKRKTNVQCEINVEYEPELVTLEEHEMFQDENGDPMEIEMRGEKTMKCAYFKAHDVGKAFGNVKMPTTIESINSGYIYNVHFKHFLKNGKNVATEQNKKVLYLTYNGVLKFLFCSRGGKAEIFQEWASNILFSMQMGSQDDKVAIASEALNVDKSTITQLFKKSCKEIPCVYLFEVGTVGNMRQHFNLDKFTNDNDKVYKYGMSNNMARRSAEHQKTFGKLTDNSFQLTVFSYIDTLFTSKAETKLKHAFDCMKIHLEDERYNELVVIEKNQIQSITELYRDIHTCYAGMNSDIIHQMQEMQVNHQIELNKKETINMLLQKDILLHKKDIDLLNNTLELERTKHKNHLQEAELNMLRKMIK